MTRVLLRPEAENFTFQFWKCFCPEQSWKSRSWVFFFLQEGNERKPKQIFCSDLWAVQLEGGCQLAEGWIGKMFPTWQLRACFPVRFKFRETGTSPSPLHASPTGGNIAFLLPSYSCLALEARAARSGLSQGCGLSQISVPGARAGRQGSWETGGRSHLQPERSFFRFHFLPRKWSYTELLFSTFTTRNEHILAKVKKNTGKFGFEI